MRILHVSEVHWGGVVSLLAHFAEAQSTRGHDVHLLAPRDFTPVNATKHDWSLDRERPGSFASAFHDLKRVAKEVRPDVIHLHSFMAGLFGRIPGALPHRRTAIVYQPHAWAFDLYSSRHRALAIRTWERWANLRTTALITNCQDELQEGRLWGIKNDGFPLGVAIDLDHFHPPDDQEERAARAACGMLARRVIVVVGRLTRQKGQDLLLPAWEAEPLVDTDLVLVGPGDTTRLAALAPTQWGQTVHAVGETKDVRSWLWASDLLALPSRYETVSLVIGEAMACGVPVVTTAVNGTREAVAEGPLAPGGAVVDLGDMVGLLSACNTRLEDDRVHRAETAQARRRAESLFDPGRVASHLEDAYEAAVEKCFRGK